MSSQAPPVVFSSQPPIPNDDIWRLSVGQYHEMIRAGILTHDDPIELLEGLLVIKMSKNPPHRIATGLVQDALQAVLPAGWYLDIQGTVTLSESEPEPDLVIARGQRRDQPDRHPGSDDVALVVEVSDSSLERDQTLKKRIYAAAGIRVYWILNLIDRRLEVYEQPSGLSDQADYRMVRVYEPSESVPLIVDDRQIATLSVATLLP